MIENTLGFAFYRRLVISWLGSPSKKIEGIWICGCHKAEPGRPYLYYLMSEHGMLLYIGQSMWIRNRLHAHHRMGRIPFASVVLQRMSDDMDRAQLSYYEQLAIGALNPPYNVRHRSCV